MNNLKELHEKISVSIHTINPVLDYDEIQDNLILLCDEIKALPDNNEEWLYIGESGYCCITDLITASYWHFSQYHGGQYSKAYATLSALGAIYSPNMECEPEENDPHFDTFDLLNTMAIHNRISVEYGKMIESGVIPYFELELINDDYLLVELSVAHNGIEFSFDSNNLPVSFDGDIEVIHDNRYLLPFDNDNNLDDMLELILANLNDGYLLSNNLDRKDNKQ